MSSVQSCSPKNEFSSLEVAPTAQPNITVKVKKIYQKVIEFCLQQLKQAEKDLNSVHSLDFNNDLNRLRFIEANARKLYYIQMQNTLIIKSRQAQSSSEDEPPLVALLDSKFEAISEDYIKARIQTHRTYLARATGSLSDLESRSNALYHKQMLFAFQEAYSNLQLKKSYQESLNFANSSSRILASCTEPISPAPPTHEITKRKKIQSPSNARKRCKTVHKDPKGHNTPKTNSSMTPAASVQSVSPASTRKKTTKVAKSFCKDIIERGKCKRSSCIFAHNVTEIHAPDKINKKSCWFRITCLNLTYCGFSHTPEETRHFEEVLKKRGMQV